MDMFVTPQKPPKQTPSSKSKTDDKYTNIKGVIRNRSHATIIAGRKGSGKTQLFLKLIKTVWKGVYTRVVIISPTFEAQFKDVFSQIDPAGLIVYTEGATVEIIEKIHKDCRVYAARGENTMVVIDDCGEQLRKIPPAAFSLWVSNSRHLLCSITHLVQKMTMSPTCLRSNVDCIIAFGATSMLDKEALYREMSTHDRKTFFAMFAKATEKQYSFMACCIQSGGTLGVYMSGLITPVTLSIQ
jgi:hypothetical protein